MKTFFLVILTFCTLYNPKVSAKISEIDIESVEKVERDLNEIVIDKKFPLKSIEENLTKYADLVKIFKISQAYNANLANRLLLKIQNHNTLSGDDLYLIKKTFNNFFILNSRMLEFSKLYEMKSSAMAKTLAAKVVNTRLVKAHLIYLSANLLLMDNMESLHAILYMNDGAFRRIFKNSFSPKTLSLEEQGTLKDLTEQVNLITDTIESKKFIQQVIFIRERTEQLAAELSSSQNALVLLSEVSTNKIANDMARGRVNFQLALHGFNDTVISIFNRFTNFLSGFFGNISGSIRWRKGYLIDNEEALRIAQSSLRPMDIILEKSPFVLTDKLIPGHYGHVAIYLGTKEQLQDLGMWNHPDILPYQEEIEAGNTILEAIRSGVHLNSVEGFMNIDEYTIVRKLNGLESPTQVYEQISRGMDQMGKPYDFNFDISTLDKIVCSELIYIVFGNVTWPTRYRVGRPTITPDDVGEVLFQKNTPFKMTNYISSTERHKITKVDIETMAAIYDYELRAENGSEIKDPKDPTNSFWKKETKCYNVANSAFGKKNCKTTYKEYTYEEAGPSIIND